MNEKEMNEYNDKIRKKLENSQNEFREDWIKKTKQFDEDIDKWKKFIIEESI